MITAHRCITVKKHCNYKIITGWYSLIMGNTFVECWGDAAQYPRNTSIFDNSTTGKSHLMPKFGGKLILALVSSLLLNEPDQAGFSSKADTHSWNDKERPLMQCRPGRHNTAGWTSHSSLCWERSQTEREDPKRLFILCHTYTSIFCLSYSHISFNISLYNLLITFITHGTSTALLLQIGNLVLLSSYFFISEWLGT